MNLKTKTCRQCGAVLHLALLDPLVGTAKDARVIFSDLPTLVCPNEDHGKTAPFHGFAEAVADQMYFGGAIPVTRTKGIVRRRQHCTRCGAAIESARMTPGRVEGRIELSGLPPFTAVVEAPTATCPSCAATQVYGNETVNAAVSEAVADAFKMIAGA